MQCYLAHSCIVPAELDSASSADRLAWDWLSARARCLKLPISARALCNCACRDCIWEACEGSGPAAPELVDGPGASVPWDGILAQHFSDDCGQNASVILRQGDSLFSPIPQAGDAACRKRYRRQKQLYSVSYQRFILSLKQTGPTTQRLRQMIAAGLQRRLLTFAESCSMMQCWQL